LLLEVEEMGKVVDIDRDMETVTREMICVKCLARYIYVSPANVPMKDLMCGGCEETGFLIDTGQGVEGTV